MSQVSTVPESCQLNAEFVMRVKASIIQVWNAIGADLQDACAAHGGPMTNEEVIESCIDASQLQTFANDPEADKLILNQCKIHGYTRVLRYLSRNIHLV